MQGAKGPADVARQRLELEAATLRSAVDGSWRQARPAWVQRMAQVAGGGSSTK